MTDKPKRVEILEKGAALTSGDRNQSYGDPHTNLTCYANLVDAYLRGKGWTGEALNSVDGAILMNLAKVSRVSVNQQHEDNYVDGATYFAIAGECASQLTNNPREMFISFARRATEVPTYRSLTIPHFCGVCRKNQNFIPDGESMFCPVCNLTKRNTTYIKEIVDTNPES